MSHEGIKSRVLHGAHELIYRYWVDPLRRWIPRLAAMRPGWRRRFLLGGVLWGASLGELAITDFRVDVNCLRGAQWSAVYIGSGKSLEEIRYVLFPGPASVEKLSRVFLWQVPVLARRLADQGELVVCELSEIVHWRPRGKYVFTVPSWIKQELDIGRPIEDILAGMNQNMRRNLRRMHENGFTYTISHEAADFDLFYHRMHLPYLRERFGNRSSPAGYQMLHRQFRQGGLLVVTDGREPVCGMLYRIAGDLCKAEQMGVLDGQFEYVKAGANVALWWFMIEWARNQGLRRFDFGGSRAQTANGSFNWKRQWGTRVAPEPDLHTEWVFWGEDLPEGLRARLNEQGFISQVQDLHLLVVLLSAGEELAGAGLAAKQEDAVRCGLDGVLLVSPSTGNSVARCALGLVTAGAIGSSYCL